MSSFFSADNLKWLLATLAIPATLGYVSYVYQKSEAQRQVSDARLRLYTELLSKREEADTGVRRGIFDKVLETYLKPGQQDLEVKIVALELLAANFHDALDLGPLFWQLDREIERAPQAIRTSLTKQLTRIAEDVKDRQIGGLELVGAYKETSLRLSGRLESAVIDEDVSFLDPDPFATSGQLLKRHFRVSVTEHDPANRRIYVFVQEGTGDKARQWSFWLDTFDFPLVNFTRLSKSERFTLVLQRYDPPSARLSLLYFPSARSGVKDKPFIDEVISDLRQVPK